MKGFVGGDRDGWNVRGRDGKEEGGGYMVGGFFPSQIPWLYDADVGRDIIVKALLILFRWLN